LTAGDNAIEIKVIDAYGTTNKVVGTLLAVELKITDEEFREGTA
jgi:hypothetical protein